MTWNPDNISPEQMTELRQAAEKGYCACGCGQKTTIAKKTDKNWGYIKGHPKTWVRGHCNRKRSYAVVDRGYKTACWIWQHYLNDRGYAQMHHLGKTQRAHRVFYEERHGSIPFGLTIDHLCEQKDCINPEHMEPVTALVNLQRYHTRRQHVESQ